MALELKGLKAKSLQAAGNISRLNAAYDKFNEAAPAHAADVEGLAPQIEALAEDLIFSAQTLGNSVAASNAGEKQVITPAEVGSVPPAILAPETPPANPAPPQPIPHTFRAEAEQQIAAGHRS